MLMTAEMFSSGRGQIPRALDQPRIAGLASGFSSSLWPQAARPEPLAGPSHFSSTSKYMYIHINCAFYLNILLLYNYLLTINALTFGYLILRGLELPF